MKRLLAAVLAALTFLSLTACGAAPQAEEAETPPPAAEEPELPEPPEPEPTPEELPPRRWRTCSPP